MSIISCVWVTSVWVTLAGHSCCSFIQVCRSLCHVVMASSVHDSLLRSTVGGLGSNGGEKRREEKGEGRKKEREKRREKREEGGDPHITSHLCHFTWRHLHLHFIFPLFCSLYIHCTVYIATACIHCVHSLCTFTVYTLHFV